MCRHCFGGFNPDNPQPTPVVPAAGAGCPEAGVLNRKDPALFLVQPDAAIPGPLQGLQPEEIDLGAIDREILTVLMSIRHPALAPDDVRRLTEAMPEDRDLEKVDPREILLAFRASDPQQLPTALHRYVEEACGKNRHGLRSVVPLAEMAGLGAAKEAALEIVSALRDWKAGLLDWSAVPRGLLLAGEPGTGRTELARAMAGEAGIRMIEASYSKWQQPGALSRFLTAMDRSFEQARANAPAIIFIDEIDAFSSRRDADANGHNDSYDVKAITALLEQLDGMAAREGVVILGACNRLDLLDPAIYRSGRFDTVIRIVHPGLEDLAAILGQHLGDDGELINLTACAATALGQTGADCAAAVRKARMSARRSQRGICTADLRTALAGEDPGYSADDWLRLAVHECGHAIVATALRAAKADFLRVDARGGICRFRELPALETAEQMHRMRCLNLAGQAAEQLMFGSFSSGSGGGADSDLTLATQSAADQIAAFGLGSTGPVWFAPAGSNDARQEALNGLLPDVAGLLEAARQDALQILTVNKDLLLRMAEELASERILFGSGLSGKSRPSSLRTMASTR